MKIGGASLADDLRRIEAVLEVVGRDGHAWRSMPTAASISRRRSTMPRRSAPYKLFWYEEAGDPLDYALQAELGDHYDSPMATGENLFSMQDARNLIRYGGMRPDRDWLQFDCALSYGLVEYLRTLEMLDEHGWSRRDCRPPRRPPDVAQHGRRTGTRRQRVVSRRVPALRRIRRRHRRSRTATSRLPDVPGIGFEEKAQLYAVMRELAA